MSAKVICKLTFLILFINIQTYGQVFITIDKDTHEFIENVNYTLFSKSQIVYKGVTFSDKINNIDKNILFDSISFTKVDYNILGIPKSKIDSVIYLSKKVIYLNELVINSGKDKDIILGETNRFVKSQYRPITDGLMYGIVCTNTIQSEMQLNKVVFYADNIKYKTAYRLNLIKAEETKADRGSQFLEMGEAFYSSDTLYLNKKDNEEVSVNLPSGLNLSPGKKVFVWIQLLGYTDKNGKEIVPNVKERTKIKFQMSKLANFYSRMSDYHTGELTESLKNINVMINYDFAHVFFKTPHKSILVTPAILLYGQ